MIRTNIEVKSTDVYITHRGFRVSLESILDKVEEFDLRDIQQDIKNIDNRLSDFAESGHDHDDAYANYSHDHDEICGRIENAIDDIATIQAALDDLKGIDKFTDDIQSRLRDLESSVESINKILDGI